MEQNLRTPEPYDYRQYDRIWQRVAPTLEPYPAAEDAAPQPPSSQQELTPAQVRQESQLPGAVPNPCCMGTAAADMMEVLMGFLEEALSDRRHYLALTRQAPVWARQRLRDIADGKLEHARHLLAIHYLVTGECYQPAVNCERIYVGRWCPARAADGTTDPCLARVLNGMSADAYRWARELMVMLERGIQSEK